MRSLGLQDIILIIIKPLLLCLILCHVTLTHASDPFFSFDILQRDTQDSLTTLSTPLSPQYFPYFLGAIALSYGIYSIDDELRAQIIQANPSTTIDSLVSFGDMLGHPQYVIPILAVGYTYGFFYHDATQYASYLTLKSVIITTIIVRSLKLLAHRSRPTLNQGSAQFDGPSLSMDDDTLSFPSSHSATAFSLATAISEQYPQTAIAVYSFASLVGWARIQSNDHFPSDVVVGALIGHYSTKRILQLDHHRHQNITISPFIYNDRYGLYVSILY